MDVTAPKSRHELEAELACLKARLREYQDKDAVQQETGEAFLQTLGSISICSEQLRQTDHALCDAKHGLKKALRRYTDLFNNSPIGYFLIDAGGFVREANQKGAELLSLSAGQLLGKPFITFIEPLDRPAFEHHLAAVFQGDCTQIELSLRPFGQALMPAILQTSLLESADDEHGPLCLAAALDISSRKRAEEELARRTEELARSNEDLERFAYVVSHDLQEPLRSIGSYVQLLGRRYKGKLDDDADTFIGFVTDGVARLSGMIRNLLAFSRITTQGQELTSQDSGAALKDALSNLEGLVEESGAEIHIGAMPNVTADRTQLVSLFQNLIANAIKYSKPGRKPVIRIQTKATGLHQTFSVADNGVGIERAQFERLFTLFQRGDHPSGVQGSGIGLAVCKRIVERHGGQIWVESTPGQGSTFHFTLDRAHP